MKTLHPKIKELQLRTAGEYLTSKYVDKTGQRVRTDFKVLPSTDDPSIIEGYLAVFGIKDSYGTVAVKGCFKKSLNERGPKSSAKDKIIHLWMHDRYEPIGQYEELFEDDYGLRFKLRVDPVPFGRPEQVRIQTKSGTLNQYSFGFEYVWDKMEYVEDDDDILMMECNLFEGSSISILASNTETYTIRSAEDFKNEVEALGIEAEEFIKSMPRAKQIEFRQLITRYKALAEIKPDSLSTLKTESKPPESGFRIGDYKIDVKQFKN